jgi:hypothetical protein
MRLFQASAIAGAYRPKLDRLAVRASNFSERLGAFLTDRYGAPHFLKPVLEGDPSAFFTNANDEVLQRMWARAHGLPAATPLHDILIAQIEHHRTEVFYTLDPDRHDAAFLRRLPGCVRRRIAWQAAPSRGASWQGYDLVVNNFPSLLETFRRKGLPVAWFAPAHDPAMEPFADNVERPVDVLFAGSYSRHHGRRAALLEAVASLSPAISVHLHLETSRMTRLAEAMPWAGPLSRHRRPSQVHNVARPAVYGLDLYGALSRARIVVNGAIDLAGEDRGNMRCFETMGCGALLLSDDGRYPDGMVPGRHLVTWKDPTDATRRILELLSDESRRRALAEAGTSMLRSEHSKERQWERFVHLTA